MKHMMLLIIVADLNLGAQGKASGVCRKDAVKNLQHGSLSCPVISDQRNPLTSFYLKGDICKQCLAGEAFGQFLYSKNVISAYGSWLQRKTHMSLDFHRLVKSLDLIQHFLTAFSSAD